MHHSADADRWLDAVKRNHSRGVHGISDLLDVQPQLTPLSTVGIMMRLKVITRTKAATGLGVTGIVRVEIHCMPCTPGGDREERAETPSWQPKEYLECRFNERYTSGGRARMQRVSRLC